MLKRLKRINKAIVSAVGAAGAVIGFSSFVSPVTLPLNIVVGLGAGVVTGTLTYLVPNIEDRE